MVKTKYPLQPNFPCCSCSSITLRVLIIISYARNTIFSCKVSAKISPLCISCYMFFVLLCPKSYFKYLGGFIMSDYNLCHGPKCHTKHTVDRVRGVKGSKVLRTRKVKQHGNNTHWYNFFCSQGCYNDFFHKHVNEIVAIEPRTECLETPILDPERKKHTHEYSWGNHSYYDTKIEVDESRQS